MTYARLRYDGYFQGQSRTQDSLFRTFTSPSDLDRFRQERTLSFAVSLPELPASRYEAKVTGVRVALVGATAKEPSISCLVRHSGRFTTRKLAEETAVTMHLEPQTAIVRTARSAQIYTGGVTATDPYALGFWGRGVAAGWTIAIEAEEIERKQIDLAGLTRIEVEIEYEAFWKLSELSFVEADLGFPDGSKADATSPLVELAQRGTPAFLELRLSQPAPANGFVVSLRCDTAAVAVPARVRIPAGAQVARVPIARAAAGTEAIDAPPDERPSGSRITCAGAPPPVEIWATCGGVTKVVRFIAAPAGDGAAGEPPAGELAEEELTGAGAAVHALAS